MTLFNCYKKLEELNISLSKADIYAILEYVSGKERDWVISNFKSQEFDNDLFESVLKRLMNQEPLAYILKTKNFYGIDFFVDNRVLIPRSDTEILVEKSLEYINKNPECKIADICTGSGAIGATIAKLKNKHVDLFDISNEAIEVAKINSKNLDINIYQGDFIEPLISNNFKYDLITINPPYIDKSDLDLQDSVKKYEPSLALFADDNGLKFYKIIINNYNKIINDENNFMIIMEFGWKQKEELENIVKQNKKIEYEFLKDYSSNWRAIVIKNK